MSAHVVVAFLVAVATLFPLAGANVAGPNHADRLHIWLDPHKMKALNVSVPDVVEAVIQQALQVSSSSLGSNQRLPKVEQFHLTIDGPCRCDEPGEIGEIIVKVESSGIIRLHDLQLPESDAVRKTELAMQGNDYPALHPKGLAHDSSNNGERQP